MSILAQATLFDELELPPLPALLQPWRPLLLCWLLNLLPLLARRHLQLISRRAAKHQLVRLRTLYDPAAAVAACANYYHCCGPGTKPTYSVELLVRAEIVRVWAQSCSDPLLEEILLTNLAARYFCGLGLFDPTPDHATLNRFHNWLARNQPRALFDDVLHHIDQHDPEPAGTTQIADTFAIESPAAKRCLTDLLLDLCRVTQRMFRQQAPQLLGLLDGMDLALLDKRPIVRSVQAKAEQLSSAAGIVSGFITRLTPALATLPQAVQQQLQAQLDLLSKVLHDETKRDAKGTLVELPLEKKGSQRLGSAHDPEARYRKHGPEAARLGSNAALASTELYIRAAVVLAGCTNDAEAPEALLKQQQEAKLALPRELVMDQAGGAGKTRARVSSVSAGQTVMVAYTPATGGQDKERFAPADFHLSADGTSMTCPGGVTTKVVSKNTRSDGVFFRYAAGVCRECPLWNRCRSADSNPAGERTVFVSTYTQHVRAAATYNASERGKQLLAGRWRIEPVVGWLVRYDGCRRARLVGMAAAQLHLYQACACRNLWRWLGRVMRGAAPLPAGYKG